jgi:hypothetical protein
MAVRRGGELSKANAERSFEFPLGEKEPLVELNDYVGR